LDEQLATGSVTGREYLNAVSLAPRLPANYAEAVLWRGVEKIVLMSATVRPKTAELLGIKPEEMSFTEYPSTFDPKRRPVIHVPSVMMNYRTEQDDNKMLWWLRRLDAVIAARLDRKGVIHGVSYKRSQFIRNNSEFGHLMLTHNAHDRAKVVEQFRNAPAPCILVSPSVDTGYDFGGDVCRYTIIAKIPFASVQDKLVKARQELDPEYGLFLAAQTIVQATGRAVRAESDWSEAFVLDDNFYWFYRKARKFLPQWWCDAVRQVDTVPPPLDL
jgi:Rad3-related DNA helicase